MTSKQRTREFELEICNSVKNSVKKINLIYEIQLLSIFKEPWHRNNKYELENNYNCVKKDQVWYYVEIIRPAFFKSVIGRSMMLEPVVVVVCR